MLGGTNIKHILLLLILFIGIGSAPTYALSDKLLITELMTGSSESASEEFVSIMNTTSEPMILNGILLQYKSSNGSSWSTRAELFGEIKSLEVLTIGSEKSEFFDIELPILRSGMSSSGGHLRLYDSAEDLELDLVGWGEASNAVTKPVDAHEKGGTIKRNSTSDGLLVNTGDNSVDFYADNPVVDSDETTEEDEVPESLENSIEKQILANTDFPTITITELMPDPTSPLVDNEDEFIEIFNPNAEPVDLDGYIIEVGLSKSKGFLMPRLILQPNEHFALYSADTSLTLSNTSSKARVIAPNNNVVFESETYEDTEPGQSYMLSSTGQWVWTKKPTPNRTNVYEAAQEQVKGVSTDTPSEASSSDDAESFSSTEKDRDYDLSEKDFYEDPALLNQSSLNYAILVGVGGLAVLYACYEYRNDFKNIYYRLVGYFKSG